MTDAYDRGDVVFGHDPFNDRATPRPWLVLSDEYHPFYGEQYVAVTLTSKSYHDGFVPIDDADWIRGGTPAESAVVPWGLASPDHDDLDDDRYQGRLSAEFVDEVTRATTTYLGLSPDEQ